MTLHSVRGADQVQDSRVSRSGRIATAGKAVRRRGPGRVVLGSKPQLATAKKLVRWAVAISKWLVSWHPATIGPSVLEVPLLSAEGSVCDGHRSHGREAAPGLLPRAAL